MTSVQHTTNYELDIGKTTVQHCVETDLLRHTHTHTHALQLIRFKTLTPKKWTSERHLTWMKLENWCTWKAAAKWLPMLFYSSFARYSAGQAAATAQWLQSRLLPLPQTLRCSALIPPVYLSLRSTIQLLHLARQGHYQVQTAWGEAELIDLDTWVDWHMNESENWHWLGAQRFTFGKSIVTGHDSHR